MSGARAEPGGASGSEKRSEPADSGSGKESVSRPASPEITHLSWGRLEVEGRESAHKDAKLFPGGSREWDWNETGTRHSPGIQPSDVEEVLEHGAREVVLARGMNGRLQVKDETLEFLEERGIPVHVERTENAVRLYNELRKERAMGGLFHSTC